MMNQRSPYLSGLNKIVMVIVVATVMATIRYLTTPHSQPPHELVVGTSADFAPFSFFDNNGTIVGFDIDLIHELLKRLNKPYRLENMPFETLLTQMQFGSIGLIAAGMSATPERALRVLFSEPYLNAEPLALITLHDSPTITCLNDLTGKTVAVNQGYVADTELSKKPGIQLLRLPSISDALLALRSHKVDAFVTGGGTVKPLQEVLNDVQITPLNELHESLAFAISKKLPALKDEIDATLRTLRDDGTLEQLREKWHLV